MTNHRGLAVLWVIVSGLALVIYGWVVLTQISRLGFELDEHRTVIWALPETGLRVGDRLLQMGPLFMRDYDRSLYLSFLDAIPSGSNLSALVVREGQATPFTYVQPGVTWAHIGFLIGDPAPHLAWLFWLTGLLTFVVVRPRDRRWQLLIAFFCLTSLWLSASLVARHHHWLSGIVYRAGAWLSVPVYWHLHWIFPTPLRSGSLGRPLVSLGYGSALLLIMLEVAEVVHGNAFVFGFLVAFAGIVVPLLARLRHWRTHRDTQIALTLTLLAAAPLFVAGGTVLLGLPVGGLTNSLLGLGLIPVGYTYVAFRRQLGGLELRVNRLITIYLFALLCLTTASILIPVLLAQFPDPGSMLLVILGAVAATAIAVLAGFAPFERAVERFVLGIPVPPRQLLGHYLARITASVDRQTVVRTLANDILPGLLVKQSALVLFADDGPWDVMYATAVPDDGLPAAEDVATLAERAGRFTPSTVHAGRLRWIQVVLPLRVEEHLLGLWLLGRHDPDDVYTQSEIALLQSLASQTALVLFSISHLDQLRLLYQSDIDQREAEHRRLARDLHDSVLNDLAVLRSTGASAQAPPHFFATYERLVRRLRQTITALRPPLLNYGLYLALRGLASDHDERPNPQPELVLEVAESDARYATRIEEYVFRIVQQAYENAVLHAAARQIRIQGVLAPDVITVAVRDDGRGFALSRDHFLGFGARERHLGLVGMRERALLIGGDLEITSMVGSGTHVALTWSAERTPQSR